MNDVTKTLAGVIVTLVLALGALGVAVGPAADGDTAPAPVPETPVEPRTDAATRGETVDRVVLIEEFTATWCGYCPEMRAAAEQIAEDYGKLQVALVEYHVWNSGTMDTAETNNRASAYGVSGIPDMWLDKVDNIHGRAAPTVQGCYNAIKAKLDPRLATPSIITIESEGDFGASTITIDATIDAVDTVSQTNLNAVFVLIEHGVSSGGTYDYVCRDIDTQAISNTGFPHDLNKALPVQAGWNVANMEALVFVQVGSSGEILQANNVGYNNIPNIPPAVTSGAVSSVSFDEDSAYASLDLNTVFSDDDGDDLTFEVTGADKLTVTGLDTGTPTITPDENWNGDETLTFTANDGRDDSPAHAVTFTVLPVNDAPHVKKNVQDFQMDEDTVHDTLDLDNNFADIDGDSLTFAASGNENIDVTVDNGNGMVTFTPAADWNGEETITLTASDGFLTASDELKVKVVPMNDAPVLYAEFAGDDVTMEEDTELYGLDLNDYFTDIDGDQLWYTSSLAENLQVKIDEWGLISVMPGDNFTGEEVVTFRATDTALEATADVTFIVTPVNDAPWLEPIDDQKFKEDVPEEVELNAIDAEDDELEFTVEVEPALTGEMTIEDGVLMYTATNDDVGSYEVTVTVEDGNGGEDKARFDLDIENVNDPPVAVITLPEDGATFVAGDPVEFDGSYSTDEDYGDRLTFRWQQGSKLIGEAEEFEKTFDKPGTFTITLTVYDEAGMSSSAEVEITVEAAPDTGGDGTDGTDGTDLPQDQNQDTGSTEKESEESGAMGLGQVGGVDVLYLVLALVAVIVVVLLIGVMFLLKKPATPPAQAQVQQQAYQAEYMPPADGQAAYGGYDPSAGASAMPPEQPGLAGNSPDTPLLPPPQ